MTKINIKKKVLASMVLGILLYIGLGSVLVSYAADQADIEKTRTSVLPESKVSDCFGEIFSKPTGADGDTSTDTIKGKLNNSITERNNVLGCAIKTGIVKLYMIPYFIQSILEFIIGLSGIVSVAAIVYGGYFYLFAGISEDKDTGKKAIQNGLIGMVVALMAWALVNIGIRLLTM